MANRLSSLSPTLIAGRAFWRLANVDQPCAGGLPSARPIAYDWQWKTFFWPLMFTGADFGPEHYDRIPRFTHRLPTDGEQLSTAGAAACLILVQVAVIAVFLLRTRHLDPAGRKPV